MAVSGDSDVAKKLASLKLIFQQQLPGKIAEIVRLWEKFNDDQLNNANLNELHRLVHSLVGSAGTYGAVTVSAISRELEGLFSFQLTDFDKATVIAKGKQQQAADLVMQLRQAADDWRPSNVPYIQPSEEKEKRDNDLIYLAEDDELLAADLVAKLELVDYRVHHFL
ncbi:MAG: Hpt domain-containing protein, partial [Gammaproteobacteria bacterium]|nr:Hpt domain-containing protein [Gammaproteobacteria bacterium]